MFCHQHLKVYQVWLPFGALVVFCLNILSRNCNQNFFGSFFRNNVMLSFVRRVSALQISIRWRWTISTVIMVWGIVLHVPFVRNISIIAIAITLLGVLSLLRGGVIWAVRRTIAGSVAIIAGRDVPCIEVSILRLNSICTANLILSVWAAVFFCAFLSLFCNRNVDLGWHKIAKNFVYNFGFVHF